MDVRNNDTNSSLVNSIFQLDSIQLALQIGLLCIGVTAAGTNAIIAILIVIRKNLRRKELLILVGLAVSDVIYAIGVIIGAIRRLYLIYNNQLLIKVSHWYCQLIPSTFFFVFGPQVSSLLSFAISIDRLLSVVWFTRYQSLNISYVYKIVGSIFAYGLVSYSVGFLLSFTTDRSPIVGNLCFAIQASVPEYGTFFNTLSATANCLSITTYVAIIFILRKRSKQSLTSQDIQQKRQMKVTKTVFFTTLADFVLEVIPWAIQTSVNTFNLPDSVTSKMSPVVFILIQCKRVVAFAIYLWKLKDIREAFCFYFCCGKGKVGDITGSTLKSKA